MRILVTGGAGFIGSNLITHLITDLGHEVLNLDALSYASSENALVKVSNSSSYAFRQVDVSDKQEVERALDEFRPEKIFHLAAESHVDRSIDDPTPFIRSNIIGTFTMLECARHFYEKQNAQFKSNFTFHHISTDEVYGDMYSSVMGVKKLFTETTPYDPSSPYSATKAGSDHLVRAWHRTFGFPTIITNCSNNYGPNQHTEKLIPLTISRALAGEEIPVYGDGRQVRDWLFVRDHVEALSLISFSGSTGSTYNIGGNNQITNLEVISTICDTLEKYRPSKPFLGKPYYSLIRHVADRPGHDKMYGVDISKVREELSWGPITKFADGIDQTVQWVLGLNTE